MHKFRVQLNNCQKYTIVQHIDGYAEEVGTIKSPPRRVGEAGSVDNLPFSKEEKFAHTLDQPGMSMFLISSQGNSVSVVKMT